MLQTQLASKTFNIVAFSTTLSTILLQLCAPKRDKEILKVVMEVKAQREERCGIWDEEWTKQVIERWEALLGKLREVSILVTSL